MMRIYANIANDDANKSKLKTQNSKVKMIVAQQKFLSEIFAELPKFCILHFEF